jgi:UDP-glucose 4-epimerase
MSPTPPRRGPSARFPGMTPTAIVTGGAGFIGSHLVDALLADGYGVTVIDDLSSGKAERVASTAELRELDIVDFASLAAVVEEVRPRAIFHLAAQASVVASVQDPGRDCEVNVKGTLNVVEAAGRCQAPVVFTSTGGALYGDDAPMPTGEDRMPAPLSPYGASKWAAESYVKTWSLSSGIPHAVCRLGNVYGPRQSPHGEAGVVAIFAHRLYTGQIPTLYGHGRPTRDYVYVGDVVSALLAASGRSGTFNVATGLETDVSTVWSELSKVADRSGVGQQIEPELADLRPGELEHSRLDASLAERELGWRPEVSIADGLRMTYEALVEEFAPQ